MVTSVRAIKTSMIDIPEAAAGVFDLSFFAVEFIALFLFFIRAKSNASQHSENY